MRRSSCAICEGSLGPDGVTCGGDECRKGLMDWVRGHDPAARRAKRERLLGERTCDLCGETFPLTLEFFPPLRRLKDGSQAFRRQCRPCWRPIRQANTQRHRDRIRQDPEKHAAWLEKERINYRLRVGREVRSHTDAMGAYHGHVRAENMLLPVEPLARWLEQVLPDDDEYMTDFAKNIEIPDRQIRGILRREHERVSVWVADRLLTRINRPVEVDGRPVYRVEDLWPALDG